MKNINRPLSSVLLAAIIAVGSAQVTEMSSIKASAAYTHDLSITGYESFNLTTDEYTDIEYRFSGEGIAAVQLKTSSNFTAYTKDVRWLEYPFTCQAFYSIKNLDGKNGSLDFCLLDDDGQEAMTFTTSVTVNISSSAPVEPTILFENMYFPYSINEGDGQHVSGTINSTENIDAVQAVVTDSSGNVWLNAKRYPGQNEYELFNSPLDWDLSFSKLPTGRYTLTYFVASGITDRSYSHSFTVRENAESGAIILFHDIEFPENIAIGKGEHIKGKITSSGIIKKIQAVITDSSSGKEVNSAVKYPNASTYVLYNSDLDWALPFGELSSGNYTLTYNVTAGSTTESYSCSFSVGKNTDMTLSRENGFSYCAKWWNKRNKSWPNKGSDCSNFAAQFLWASGLQTDSKFTPGSRTVLGFDNLKKYLYETYGVETIMRKRYSDCLAVEKGFAKYKSKLSAKDVSPGDLVVMPGYDSNGNLINDGHIMIVYKVKGSKIYCYGHSNNRNGKKYYVNDSYIQGVVKTSALFE